MSDEDDFEDAPAKDHKFIEGEARALKARSISEETCAHWGYTVGTDKHGATVQLANHYVNGKLVGQKVRAPGKKFSVVGKLEPLYGQWLWRDGGKMVVVTEGEIDALSVSQVQDNKWPVVSISNGATSAAKSFRESLEWLEKFEKVILMFDQDEPGREAAVAAAEVLSPGKAFIAELPLKDANEMLKAGRVGEIISAIWGAKPYRPDGIVCAADLGQERLLDFSGYRGTAYPWGFLTEKLGGIRERELTVLTAGTGVGKSTVAAEIANYLLVGESNRVGYVALEESTARAAQRFLSLQCGVPLHTATPEEFPSKEVLAKAHAAVPWERLFLYDHFGSMDPEVLVRKVRYLARGLQVPFVFLDHLSIVISGWETDDERKALDITMTKLRSLVEETGIHLFLISHLRRPSEGNGHEGGREVRLSDLRGSQAIAQLADNVIAFERDLQDPGSPIRVRVLKERLGGRTGAAGALKFERDTGRLVETQWDSGPKFSPVDDSLPGETF